MRTRAKICGITRVEDVHAVVNAGCDAIGFVFYPPSPRSVTLAQAEILIQTVPAYVQAVGLFVNSSADEILALIKWDPDKGPQGKGPILLVGHQPYLGEIAARF